jgi:RimJ/RimL family protein N-acetyltransferase
VGAAAVSFELQPHLAGELLELRPLRPEDRQGLFAAASDPMIWEQHPVHDRYKEEVFTEYFRGALESSGALVAIDKKSGKILGCSRYCEYDAEKSEVEIGWTFLARSHWGGTYNGEMKRLMLHHAFTFADSVLFVVGTGNLRSQKAVEKIGGIVTGRKDVPYRGAILEHLIYQIKKASHNVR